ncbi:pescadillo homolog [Panulirus ornatus]|uniref:pescadillo homolog n=1 Tax=Panulirus ornatus TaxID=150431 RepID=UPI003A899B0B
MANTRKKKGESGEATRYISRNRAVKKLQLSLRDFRRLCILKGIYPREPKHRKKVQKGDSTIKTLYYLKDIQFLSHEPIIWKFREHRAYMKKVHKATARKEPEKADSLWLKKPIYKLDHVVRERYPSFVDALHDLEDPLTLCFLFSKLARLRRLQEEMLHMCRRLTVEFMHYVIEARALRKVFISFKGYYYQAEIMGQTVTWIAPHPFAPHNATDADLRLMKVFVEFYITMLGFVNCRLYHELNIHYPPKLCNLVQGETEEQQSEIISERVASLNIPLLRSRVEEDDDEVGIDIHLFEDEMELHAAREEEKKKKQQQSLFKGLKFFLNRETNMESLTFVIRACMGKVSWDVTAYEGSTYPETDESITHQIVDRKDSEQKYLSRYYIQPQWVYDCINARMLLPVQDYFPSAVLPVHLSPFEDKNNLYVPPEKVDLLALQKGDLPTREPPGLEDSEDEDTENEEEIQKENEVKKKLVEVKKQVGKAKVKGKTRRERRKNRPKDMAVRPGLPVPIKKSAIGKQELEEKRLSVMMIPRKQKRMYRILKRKEERQAARVNQLTQKRKAIDELKKGQRRKTLKIVQEKSAIKK